MGRKRKSKKGNANPDEYFAAGPMEFARFGRHMVSRPRVTSDELQAMKVKMAEKLPAFTVEIDVLVARIADQVARLPPDRLLHRAWWEFSAMVIGVGGEKASDMDQATAMRMIDYVQSVIASVHPTIDQSEEVTEAEWATLSKDVRTLFTRLSIEYPIYAGAQLPTDDLKSNNELEHFRLRALTMWMNVRGVRYQPHERWALLDVLTPHSDVLACLFGVDASTIVVELEKILLKLTRGLMNLFSDLKQLQEDTLEKLPEWAKEAESADIEVLRRKLAEDPELTERHRKFAGEFHGVDFFDVEMITQLPKSLLTELAWSPGEEQDFFAAGEFSGWPLRVWPTMKRPFIRLNGRVLCFDIFSLFDNIYRVLQRTIFRLAPDYKAAWNDRQKTVSEELPFKYFERLLPSARTHRPVYYRWKAGSGPTDWHEADGLLIYDDHLFIIEVKAGAFTYTPPATDLPAHIDSLKSLVLSPIIQGSRFLDYLESATEVPIFDADHTEVGRLRRSDFRHITICAVTLDSFTELAARAQHLKSVGIDIGRRGTWVLSVDDLRVYADLFGNPLIFLHFVEQRTRASNSELVDLNDEMDHVGMYVQENNYSRYATELMDANHANLSFHGYRKPVDDYYSAIVQDEFPVQPKQQMSQRLSEIIAFLAATTKPGRSEIASFLLDASGDQREKIAKSIDEQLAENKSLGRNRPRTSYGEHAFTLYTWSPTAPRNAAAALEHAKNATMAAGKTTNFLIELEYSASEVLTDVHWSHVGLDGLSEQETTRLHRTGMELRRKRLITARTQRKIGVNETCPCGSGKKYKRCCKP